MPTRERTLRSEARETAEWRGHSLGRFSEPVSLAGYPGSTGREAVCTRCGMTVGVYPGVSYEVVGEAIALDCPYELPNPVRDYRESHPENVVWSPSRGWHDQ